MRIYVKLFAALREATGASALEVELEADARVEDALQRLFVRHPSLSTARFAVAVNRSYAKTSTPLSDGDEVALIPPVSGG